jgi:hypothetical protein
MTQQLKFNLTSDLAGTVYALAILGSQTGVPTVAEVIAQANFTNGTVLATGIKAVTAATSTVVYLNQVGSLTNAAHKVYYVVVGSSSVSEVKLATLTLDGSALSASASLDGGATGAVLSITATAAAQNSSTKYAFAVVSATEATKLGTIIGGRTTLLDLQNNLGITFTLTGSSGTSTAITAPATAGSRILIVIGMTSADVIVAWKENSAVTVTAE